MVCGESRPVGPCASGCCSPYFCTCLFVDFPASPRSFSCHRDHDPLLGGRIRGQSTAVVDHRLRRPVAEHARSARVQIIFIFGLRAAERISSAQHINLPEVSLGLGRCSQAARGRRSSGPRPVIIFQIIPDQARWACTKPSTVGGNLSRARESGSGHRNQFLLLHFVRRVSDRAGGVHGS